MRRPKRRSTAIPSPGNPRPVGPGKQSLCVLCPRWMFKDSLDLVPSRILQVSVESRFLQRPTLSRKPPTHS